MDIVRAQIDLAAMRRNLATLATRVAPAELMIMVKANAYGHGLLPVAHAAVAGGVPWLGVLDAASGLSVRAAGIDGATRLFAWLFSPGEDYAPIIDADIDLGISHLHQLDRLAASGAHRPARLHLKIDTGLHRNGASEAEWPHLVSHALELEAAGVVEVYGVWTHIGEASDFEDSLSIARFDRAIAVAESLGARFRIRHLAASAAGFSRSDARYDAVRVGAFAYGIAPGDGIGPDELGIEPVMTLGSSVIELRSEGDRVVATLDGGYLDGMPGNAPGRVTVLIGGRQRAVLRVGASSTEVDVTPGREAPDRAEQNRPIVVGDTAVLFGATSAGAQTLQEWADELGTIGEELVVRLGPRLEREYLGALT